MACAFQAFAVSAGVGRSMARPKRIGSRKGTAVSGLLWQVVADAVGKIEMVACLRCRDGASRFFMGNFLLPGGKMALACKEISIA